MQKNEPNKIVARLFKQYQQLRAKPNGEYHKLIEPLKKELADITNVVGAIEVMSKANILKLCLLQSRLRFMEYFKFGIQFDKACSDLLKLQD